MVCEEIEEASVFLMDHKIEKPTVFISHASSDAEFANAVHQEIEKVFAGGVSVFCTSSPGAIRVGSDWLSEIESKLQASKAVVAIVTPVSIERPWLWFELGATWLNGRTGNCKIYPLCAPEVDLSDLPSPLDRLQALSMGKPQDLKLLFERFVEQFGFGKISSFKPSNITKRIPKYSQVKIKPDDLESRGLYSGRYSGYSDSELEEVIDTHLFEPDQDKFDRYGDLHEGREDLVHNGKLMHYRGVDKKLDLPPGTSRRLLNRVAERYGLVPALESENIVRYKLKVDFAIS